MTEHKKRAHSLKVRRGPEYVFDEEIVPLPAPKRTEAIYFPLDILEIGRSFRTMRKAAIRGAIKRYRDMKADNRKFSVRDLPDGGCRVWRVK